MTVGIAYICCKYHDKASQGTANLISSISARSLQGSSIPELVQELYDSHASRGINPTLGEVKKLLKLLIGSYTTVFIIVDTLDESRDHGFYDELRALRQTASLVEFSRRNSRIEREYQDCLQLEANLHSAEDIKSYVAHRIDDP